MIPNEEHIKLLQTLLSKQDPGPDGLKILFKLYNSERGHEQIRDMLEKRWPEYRLPDSMEIDSEKIWRRVKSDILDNLNKAAFRVTTFYKWTAGVAASLLAIVLISSILFLDVRLKNADTTVALTEIVALPGQPKDLELPDGTHVWLNPGSSLVYSKNMNTETVRDVRLTGQAYFKVAKNQEAPFVLQMGDIGLKVTGTSFNASGYRDDSHMSVALESGEVKLFEGSYFDAEKFTLLRPGEIAFYTKGSRGFKIEKAEIEKYTAWTNGVLIFRDEPLADVFRRMERWYNVKIVVEDPRINSYRYTATIKNESLEQILQLLEYTSHLECAITENQTSGNSKRTVRIKTQNNLPMK